MSLDEILNPLKRLQGSFGAIVRTAESEDMLNYRAAEYFPLASTAKLVLGAVAASLVESGDLSWNLPIKGLTLDPEEDSHLIYPHLQSLSQLSLSHVVEIMIACHDHHCANAVADTLGGWASVESLVSGRFPGIKMNRNPRDEERNVGQLDALLGVFQYVVDSYQSMRQHFEPVVAGLVRMADKTPGIAPHHQWNMTGGLSHALLNIGVLGNPMRGSYLMYVVAGRDLASRALTQEADDRTTGIIQTLYEMWKNALI